MKGITLLFSVLVTCPALWASPVTQVFGKNLCEVVGLKDATKKECSSWVMYNSHKSIYEIAYKVCTGFNEGQSSDYREYACYRKAVEGITIQDLKAESKICESKGENFGPRGICFRGIFVRAISLNHSIGESAPSQTSK